MKGLIVGCHPSREQLQGPRTAPVQLRARCEGGGRPPLVGSPWRRGGTAPPCRAARASPPHRWTASRYSRWCRGLPSETAPPSPGGGSPSGRTGRCRSPPPDPSRLRTPSDQDRHHVTTRRPGRDAPEPLFLHLPGLFLRRREPLRCLVRRQPQSESLPTVGWFIRSA